MTHQVFDVRGVRRVVVVSEGVVRRASTTVVPHGGGHGRNCGQVVVLGHKRDIPINRVFHGNGNTETAMHRVGGSVVSGSAK